MIISMKTPSCGPVSLFTAVAASYGARQVLTQHSPAATNCNQAPVSFARRCWYFPIRPTFFTRRFCQAALLLCLATAAKSTFAQIVLPASGYINTIAGNGTAGYSPDGTPAASAELNDPMGVAVDSSGDVWFADTGNCVIREVRASDGDIYTVAGQDGMCAYGGDGGSAVDAELDSPTAVALDSSGNLYISDTGNNRVREVASGGVINTIAGGGASGYTTSCQTATDAALSGPAGVAVDASGDVYIADFGNYVVGEVSGGSICAVAGDGTEGYPSGSNVPAASAEIAPGSVAVDSSGNVYITNGWGGGKFGLAGGCAILELAGGVINTVAGNGTCGYSGDDGQATSAKLEPPAGLAVDSRGNLYITGYTETYSHSCDPVCQYEYFWPNSSVREVTASTGLIYTIAGGSSGGYAGDGGAATSAELQGPSGVAVDQAGNVYIGDTENLRIRAVGGWQSSPSTATTFANLQSESAADWSLCEGECPINGTNTGDSNDYGWLYTSTNPSWGSLSGNAFQEGDTSTSAFPYYDVLFTLENGGELDHNLSLPNPAINCTTGPCPFSNLELDLWFSLSSYSSIENLEFDPDYTDADGYVYKMSMECTSPNNTGEPSEWNYWDQTEANEGGSGWQPTGESCSNVWANMENWQHLQIYVTVNNSAHTYAYQSVLYNSGPVSWSNMSSTAINAANKNWTPNVYVEQEIDNTEDGGTSEVYYDDYYLTVW